MNIRCISMSSVRERVCSSVDSSSRTIEPFLFLSLLKKRPLLTNGLACVALFFSFTLPLSPLSIHVCFPLALHACNCSIVLRRGGGFYPCSLDPPDVGIVNADDMHRLSKRVGGLRFERENTRRKRSTSLLIGSNSRVLDSFSVRKRNRYIPQPFLRGVYIGKFADCTKVTTTRKTLTSTDATLQIQIYYFYMFMHL